MNKTALPFRPLNFPAVPGLTAEEREKESELAQIVQGESADQQYNAIPLTFHGLVINIDLYRELLPSYRLGPEGLATDQQRIDRTRYTAATFGPAKAASFDRFQRETATARRVVLLGGGPASGKTSMLRGIIDAVDPLTTTVYDTSLTDPATAEREVRKALENDRQVDIYWVFKSFPLAVEGMITRAVKEGRYLTLERMVDLHQGSRETILRLIRQFSGIHALSITALRSAAEGDVRIPLAELASVLNNPTEDMSYGIALRQFHHCEARLGIQDDLKDRMCRRSPR